MNNTWTLGIKCSSHLVIQDLVGYLRNPELSDYLLSENVEGRLE